MLFIVSSLAVVSAQLNSNDILIISGGVEATDRPFAAWTQENQQTFADAMGYRYEAKFESVNETDPEVQPYWHKVYLILDKLQDIRKDGSKKNKVVVWMDDDGIVVRMDDMIERYLHAYSHDVIMAEDADGHAYVNSGLIIVRNSAQAVEFFQEVLQRGELTRTVVQNSRTFQPELQVHHRWLMKCRQAYDCLHEQQAMKELIQGKQDRCVPDWDVWNHKRCWDEPIETSNDWGKIVAVVPQRDKSRGLNLNIYSRDLLGENSDKIAMIAAQDFFVQATGLPPAKRAAHIQELISLSSTTADLVIGSKASSSKTPRQMMRGATPHHATVAM